MAFKTLSNQMLPAIEQTLRSCVEQDIPERYAGVQEMMAYHFGWQDQGNTTFTQGKRIRPLVVLLSTALFSQDWKKALPAAAAVELLHNFSLIHDDIEDNSALRRGRDTVWRIWGIPQAINTGDAMFTLSQVCLLKMRDLVSAEITLEAVRLFNETCIHLTGGQYLDMDFETRPVVPTDLYFQMIAGKTAALLSACAELGAIITGTTATNRMALRQFGKSLGLAFQIWDDWLGIWGDENQTGKSAASDLLNGKKTLPILYALDQKQAFYQFVNQPGFVPDPTKIAGMITALQADGAKDYTEQLAKEYTQQAYQAIQSLSNVDAGIRDVFLELSDQLLKRGN